MSSNATERIFLTIGCDVILKISCLNESGFGTDLEKVMLVITFPPDLQEKFYQNLASEFLSSSNLVCPKHVFDPSSKNDQKR